MPPTCGRSSSAGPAASRRSATSRCAAAAGRGPSTDDLAAFRGPADAVARWQPALVELAAATGIAGPGAGDDHLAALRDDLASLTASGVGALAEWVRFHAARVAAREAG